MKANEEIPTFDGFDSNGKLTGHKVKICIKQFEDCEWQFPFGDGAFFTCWCEGNKCILNNKEDENSTSSTR